MLKTDGSGAVADREDNASEITRDYRIQLDTSGGAVLSSAVASGRGGCGGRAGQAGRPRELVQLVPESSEKKGS